MQITYTIEVAGFDAAPHAKAFHTTWLMQGPEALFAEARKLAEGQRSSDRYSSQPAHGRPPVPTWYYIGCLGPWRFGDARMANCHCLELFRDPQGHLWLVDQSEHGDFQGHSLDQIVLAEVPA